MKRNKEKKTQIDARSTVIRTLLDSMKRVRE